MSLVQVMRSLVTQDPEYTNYVWCTGGNAPPRNCNSEMFTHNSQYTECVCKDGYYPEGGGCAPCPAGAKCVGGVKEVCPMHTYQNNARSTHCINCVATGDENGIYTGCSDKQQLSWCLPGKADALEANCVPCTHCKRSYLTVEAGSTQKDCYRSA